ncbi:uncharacterized protein K02A2.6 [Dendroctonus ponderosae]|uniref:uncharacterized protein K02A2.6 n=1 Tax=Dendroctonus ponderosae TaxID=77166 RepID=UPI002035A8F3|nr:uncharacterized protein K02A2.6 [Dendroctonus ponderosae]
MNKQIQDMVMVCNTCQTYQNTQTREPMIPHEIVKRPWHKVACDLFHLYGEQYLLVVDYYSKFFELGIPTIVMSDNGPEFSSIKFREFSVNWEFKHIKSSPRYPQSNGLVERYIQTVKNTLRKSMMDKKDPFLALLDLRNTPIDGKHSPANVLMNRHLRDLLPRQLNSKPFRKRIFDQFLENSTNVQKTYYDKKSKSLKVLKVGDRVRVQINPKVNKWHKASIIRIAGFRSYMIELERGGTLIRNRRFIRKCKNNANSYQTTTRESKTSENKTDFSNYRVIRVGPNINRFPDVLENREEALGEAGDRNNVSNSQGDLSKSRSGRVVKTPALYKDFVMM